MLDIRALASFYLNLPDKLEQLMADLTQVQTDIAALQEAEAAAATELQALADQVGALRDAGADAVSDADLEQLHQNLQDVTSSLAAATQSAQTQTQAVPPQPEQPA